MQAATTPSRSDSRSSFDLDEHMSGLTTRPDGMVGILDILPWLVNPTKQLEKLAGQSGVPAGAEGVATITEQPGPREDLELGRVVGQGNQGGEGQNASGSAPKARRRSRWRTCSSPLRCTCMYMPTWCFTCFFRAEKAFGMAGGMCFIALMFVIIVAISLACASCLGAAWMVLGNAVLRAAHLPGYIESNKVVAAVGFVGGIFAPFCVRIFLAITCVPKTEWRGGDDWEYAWWINVPAMICSGALVGPIGVSILRRHSFDLEGFDILHATRAGVLGPAILIPASLVLKPIVYVVLGVILTPLWIAMQMGLEFVYIKGNQTPPELDNDEIPEIDCSFCICIGSLRDDEEIVEEI